MADLNARIIAKASATASEQPLPADLEVAELAVNTADGILFTKHTDGTIKEISGSGGEASTPQFVAGWGGPRGIYNDSDGGITIDFPATAITGDLAIVMIAARNETEGVGVPTDWATAGGAEDGWTRHDQRLWDSEESFYSDALMALFTKTLTAEDIATGWVRFAASPIEPGASDHFPKLLVYRNAEILDWNQWDSTVPGISHSGYKTFSNPLPLTQSVVGVALGFNVYSWSDPELTTWRVRKDDGVVTEHLGTFTGSEKRVGSFEIKGDSTSFDFAFSKGPTETTNITLTDGVHLYVLRLGYKSTTVTSVNGETGAVSLGIQDMDDFGLYYADAAVDLGTWNDNVGGGFPEAAGEWRVYAADTPDILQFFRQDKDGNDYGDELLALKAGDIVEFSSDDGVSYQQVTLVADAEYSIGNGGNTTLSIDISDADGTLIAAESSVKIRLRYTTLLAPLSDGDILQWVDAEQKFKPAQIENAANAVTSVNGETGAVSLSVLSLSDFDSQGFPATVGEAANGSYIDGFADKGRWYWDSSTQQEISQYDADGNWRVVDYFSNWSAGDTVEWFEVGVGSLGSGVMSLVNVDNSYRRVYWFLESGSISAPSSSTASVFVVNHSVEFPATQPAEGDILQWNNSEQRFKPAQISGDAVDSVNGETGDVSLGVYELDDTALGGYAAPAKGSSYPSTGISYLDVAGGGGAWGTASVFINRSDGMGTIDNTDYSYLVNEEIRIYQTDITGVPNGTTWTVTALTYETGTDGDGWYGFTFASQGAAPTGTYYFRIGVGVLPVDGTVLTYDGATETWKAIAPATSLITSVNDQTGAVSLGIQDMNDYALKEKSDEVFTFTEKVANNAAAALDGQFYIGNASASFIFFGFVNGTSNAARDAMAALNVGDDVTFSAPGLSDHVSTVQVAIQNDGASQTESYLRINDSWPLEWLNVSDGPIEVSVSTTTALGEEIPLVNGDILKWDDVDQKFKPGPQVAIADGSTTGSVLTWNGTDWGETNAVVDGSGDINLGALGDVDLTVTATDKDSLVYEASSGTWKAVNMDPSNPLDVVLDTGGIVNITSASHQKIVRANASGAVIAFGAGQEGEYAYVVNNTGGDLTIGGSISTGDGLTTVKSNGIVAAYYANSTWNVSGDLYTPGATFAYTLEGATDYTAPGGGKSDGDVITWDETNGYWSAGSVTGQLSTYLSGTAKLQDLSNVTLSSALDDQYLVYDSASGNWISEQLDTSGITQEVQLNTNLDDLANVLTSGKANGDLLSWDNNQNAWVPSSAGGGIDGKADKNMTFRPIVGDYQLIESDNNKLIEVTTPSVVALPSSVSTGFQCVIMRTTTGTVSLAGTILSAGTTNEITTQYGAVTAVHKGSGTWYVFGDLS